MSRSSPEAVASAEGALALLQQLFPSTDPAFLRSCISHHQQSSSSSTAAIANVVERVSDKLLESGTAADSSHATREEWPRVRWWKYDDQEEDCDDDDEVEPLSQRGRGGNRGTIAARQDVRSAFDKSTGAGASPARSAADAAPAPPAPARRHRGRRVPDLTTERNLALYVISPITSERTDSVLACAHILPASTDIPGSDCTESFPPSRSQVCAR